MDQRTLKKSYVFEGKGLHTGTHSRMTVRPAPAGSGITFRRMDLGGASVKALAENVTSTARSTTIACGEAQAVTIEHLMSALFGLGIDNADIELSNVEVPILDGSARPYVEAFMADGLESLGVERKLIGIPRRVEVADEKSGSRIVVEPASEPSFEVTVDFGSRVLGVQKASWIPAIDYAGEIGLCRTFVFLHEIEALMAHGLIKGGDIDNAIVVVERPVTQEHIEELEEKLGYHGLSVSPEGYLSNVRLHFPNECGRHKLLDILGDFYLCGGYLNAKVTAFKPGHGINTSAAKAIRALIR